MKNGKIGVTTENIFPVIKKFLYSDHEIFLRELISNAVDATQKLKTLSAIGEAKGWRLYTSEAIGAVNCIRRTADGRLAGHNTDVIGLRAALNELLGAAQPVQALVLGTGGASQAVQYALAERDIPFALVSREAAKGNYTYDDLPCEAVESSRLIVNASPVGTYPNVDAAPRIPYAYVTPEHYLLDLVYNPPLTQFLDYGRQRRCV